MGIAPAVLGVVVVVGRAVAVGLFHLVLDALLILGLYQGVGLGVLQAPLLGCIHEHPQHVLALPQDVVTAAAKDHADNKTIVTNGDQTDTIYELMNEGETFEESLRTREFEPDGPNYTPRISGIVKCSGGVMEYAMSILKSADGIPDSCQRYTFMYSTPLQGLGRYIHTYMGDGTPLPSFEGEPTLVEIGNDDIDTFAEKVWNALDEDNKV